jgi:uncharacterized repeat protein (TIGR01451 family)
LTEARESPVREIGNSGKVRHFGEIDSCASPGTVDPSDKVSVFSAGAQTDRNPQRAGNMRRMVKETAMRRMVWCFLVGGLVSANSHPAKSEGRPMPSGTEQSATAAPAAPTAFRRSTTGAPAAGANRKRYAELWATQPAAESAEARAPAAEEEEAPAAPVDETKETRPARTGTFTVTGGRRKVLGVEPLSGDVVRAEYQRQPGEVEQTEIQQVRAESSGARKVIRRPAPNRLTDPIQTSSAAAAAPVTTAPPAPVEDIPAPPRAPVEVAEAPAPAAPDAPSPVAGPQSPALSLKWVKASEISVGREFTCELLVQNTGGTAARDVEVAAHFPAHVRLVRAEPQPAHAEGLLGWVFGEMPAGASQTIRITMIPTQAGEIAPHADVRFTGAVAAKFAVSEPMLAIALEGPQEVLIGEAASQTIVVTNPGSGVATHVQVEAIIPAGLEHARGSRLLMDLGALHPGETRSVRLPLAAVAGGSQIIQVQARADADLVQNAAAEVAVIAPELAATIEGPGLRYLGRRATYSLQVTNTGSVATDNVRVMHKVPEGFEFVSAAQGAQYDEATHLLNWFVGQLEQGQTATAEVTFACSELGEFTHYVRATSEHGTVSDTQVATKVEGTPSLSLDIRDFEDPVEVGTQTDYEIRVKNEGSAAAQNVNVSCELPAGLTVVSVKAPVSFAADRDLIVFQPLAEIKPGESVSIRMQVKATGAGNLRLRARLSSESIEEPLVVEELTKFYGE